MTGKHTPGPWDRMDLTIYALTPDRISGRKVNRFSTHVQPGRGIEDEEMLANARLIAAAPDLLEALEQIAKGEGRFNRNSYEHACNTIVDMMDIAKATLSKARGEEG